jgi:hypothetical protein
LLEDEGFSATPGTCYRTGAQVGALLPVGLKARFGPETSWQTRFDSLNKPFRACWLSLARPCSFSETHQLRSFFLVDHSIWFVRAGENGLVMTGNGRGD